MHGKSAECQPRLGENTPESGTENGGITVLVLANKSDFSSDYRVLSCASQVVSLSIECFLQKSRVRRGRC